MHGEGSEEHTCSLPTFLAWARIFSGQDAKVLDRLSSRLAAFARDYTPDAFVIAVLLTVLTFCLALVFGDATPLECVRFWGGGFWTLLTFGMQMCLVVFSGYLLAVSPPVARLLAAFASVPRSPRAAVVLLASASVILCWLNWGVGLIASAMMVSCFARKQPDADYRILVVAAYLGMGCSWHVGPSGSVPLLLATPGHFLEARTGVLPLTETVFQLRPLCIAAAVCTALVALCPLLLPPPLPQVSPCPLPHPSLPSSSSSPCHPPFLSRCLSHRLLFLSGLSFSLSRHLVFWPSSLLLSSSDWCFSFPYSQSFSPSPSLHLAPPPPPTVML